MNVRLSPEAYKLVREVEHASEAKLRHLSWAFYGTNKPSHPIHILSTQETSRIWQTLKDRKHFFAQREVGVVMALFLSTEAEVFLDILRKALSYHSAFRLQRPASRNECDRRVHVTVRRVYGEDRLHRRA
jgi:hypothetical protein